MSVSSDSYKPLIEKASKHFFEREKCPGKKVGHNIESPGLCDGAGVLGV